MFATGPRAVGFTIVWPEGVIFRFMMTYHVQFLLLVLAGWVNRQQQDVIDYLQEENRVLRAGLRGKRLSLSDDDRRRLAVKAQALGREALAQITSVATPATLLRWYRCPSCPKTQTNSRLARRAVSMVIDLWRAPDLGRVGGDVGDSGSPYAQGKHRPATGCHAPGRRPGSRPGPHLDQNVLAGYAAVALALILDPSGSLFFRRCTALSATRSPLWRKRGTRKARLETKTENEASSALLARLW